MGPVSDIAAPQPGLRAYLRSATMSAHDLLDDAMQAASGWQTRHDYARFLALQYAARLPLEAWLAAHAPAGLIPPHQTPLLARDLEALGVDLPPACPLPATASFRPSASALPATALGVAWALAGSALGNRAIARQVAQIGGGAWPVAFLGDGAMMAFWQSLRVRIEGPVAARDAESAARAADAVFAHFLAVAAPPWPMTDAPADSIPA